MAEEEKNETTEETPAVEETPVAEEASVEESEAVAVDAAEATDATPAAEGSIAEGDQPASTAKQSKPRKRLPRAQRPQKTRPKRAASTGERKPITRLPKPESERGRRQERRGVVVSDAMDKTIVVKVDTIRSHPRYKKVIRRSIKFHAHDEQNSAKVGDVVRIVETRPLSKTKNWRLAEIVEVAK
jgi:small subunit ribosomal protein S17